MDSQDLGDGKYDADLAIYVDLGEIEAGSLSGAKASYSIAYKNLITAEFERVCGGK